MRGEVDGMVKEIELRCQVGDIIGCKSYNIG